MQTEKATSRFVGSAPVHWVPLVCEKLIDGKHVFHSTPPSDKKGMRYLLVTQHMRLHLTKCAIIGTQANVVLQHHRFFYSCATIKGQGVRSFSCMPWCLYTLDGPKRHVLQIGLIYMGTQVSKQKITPRPQESTRPLLVLRRAGFRESTAVSRKLKLSIGIWQTQIIPEVLTFGALIYFSSSLINKLCKYKKQLLLAVFSHEATPQQGMT